MSAKGAAARHQSGKGLACSWGGAGDSATVLRELLKSAKGAATRHQSRKELVCSLGGAGDSATVLREFLRRRAKLLGLAFLFVCSLFSANTAWRAATEDELKRVIPARAPVEKERIETEFRTASGITDGKAVVAGVVLITAGYSADGKYSHFLLTDALLEIGNFTLPAGHYVFGWQKNADSLTVKFYGAETGKYIGSVEAERNSRIGKIESFHIYPPGDKSSVQIGRFAFAYRIR